MNLRSWLMAVGLVGACLAISQAATSPSAVAAVGKSNAKTKPTFLQPLVVDNPFAAEPHAAQPQAAQQHNAEPKSVAPQPIAGFQVDSEAPQVYRLPGANGVEATESEERIAAALPPAVATEPPAEAWPSEATVSMKVAATENETPKNDTSQTTDKPQLVAANDDILPLPAEPGSSSPQPTATVAAEPEQVSSESTSPEPQSTELAAPTSDSPIAAAPEPGFSPSPSYGTVVPKKDATAFSANSAEMVPYMPVTAGLSAQLLPSVQRAYALAQRGSLYAAQTEFVQVLRRIAQAKDADEGYDDHSRALAAGLRALDEADDFAPSGVQLEAEMNVAVTVSSHRTPVLRGSEVNELPQEAIAKYHYFAQQQLALAVEDEQAGSMALHGLGKVYCRLAEETPNDARRDRKAMTMFLAALDAGPQNHLAANEVGVLLSRGGHDTEAAAMFKRAIDLAPSSTAYHNLAACERKLGQLGQSSADGQYGDMLASRERSVGAVSRSLGVQWVTPQELAGVPQPQPLPPSQRANPIVASRPTTPPLGPSPTPPASPQPTHAPNARWW